MTLWLAIPLAVLLLAIVLTLSSSIVFHFKLCKRDKNDRVVLDIAFLYGLFKLHYVLPSVVFEGITRGVKVKLEESGIAPVMKKERDNEKHIDKEVVDTWLDTFKKALAATKGLKKWFKDTLSHVRITKLDWSTDFSLGDAAGTATAAGALWGLKWSIIGWGSQWVRLKKKPRLFVVPVFEDDLSFATEMVCSGSFRMLHALSAGIRLAVRASKVKHGLSLWKELIRSRS